MNYGVKCDRVPFLCDNVSEIKIAANHVQHSRTKHIVIILFGILWHEKQLADISC